MNLSTSKPVLFECPDRHVHHPLRISVAERHVSASEYGSQAYFAEPYKPDTRRCSAGHRVALFKVKAHRGSRAQAAEASHSVKGSHVTINPTMRRTAVIHASPKYRRAEMRRTLHQGRPYGVPGVVSPSFIASREPDGGPIPPSFLASSSLS